MSGGHEGSGEIVNVGDSQWRFTVGDAAANTRFQGPEDATGGALAEIVVRVLALEKGQVEVQVWEAPGADVGGKRSILRFAAREILSIADSFDDSE